jgi:hypothetical protein
MVSANRDVVTEPSYERVCRAHPCTYIRLGCVLYDFGLCGRRATSSLMEGPCKKVKTIAEYFALISKQSAAHSVQVQPLLR